MATTNAAAATAPHPAHFTLRMTSSPNDRTEPGPWQNASMAMRAGERPSRGGATGVWWPGLLYAKVSASAKRGATASLSDSTGATVAGQAMPICGSFHTIARSAALL